MKKINTHIIATNVIKIAAVATAILALAGLIYNISSLLDIEGILDENIREMPYIKIVYYTLISITTILYTLLSIFSILIIKGRHGYIRAVLVIFVIEIILFIAVGVMWNHPVLGRSVAGATGISLGGLMFQFLTLNPVWAPLLFRKGKEKGKGSVL